MADNTPNLDDGEWWLPSGMFPDEGVSRSHRDRRSSEVVGGQEYTSWDLAYLTRKLATLGLLDYPNQSHSISTMSPSNLSSHLEGFLPHLPLSSMAFDGGYGYGYGGSLTSRCFSPSKNGGYRPAPSSLHPANPGKSQVQVPGERYPRARVMQGQQNQDQSQFLPSRVNGNSRRECGGTGFFLPRVASNHSRKKTSINKKGNGGESQNQKQTPRDGAVGKHGMSLQPPSAVGLPQDWTY